MLILLKTFTTGFKLGWILRLRWFVNVSMIILAPVMKGDTRVNWRIVMLKAFIGIFRNPTDKENENLLKFFEIVVTYSDRERDSM